MDLPLAALDWLRAVHAAPVPSDPRQRRLTALALGLVAARVPAWIEPAATVLDRLGGDPDAAWVRAAVAGGRSAGPLDSTALEPGPGAPEVIDALGGIDALRQLATGGVAPVPQIVGVPLHEAALRRAEWVDGHLHLHLVPVVADIRRRVVLRLVGAEPRQWDIAGIDGVIADLSSQGLHLLVPLVHGTLVLSRGSY